MIRIIFKLTAVFFIAMGLYACGGMVQTVKQTFAKDTAHIAFERKDYPTALTRFQDAAELGNAEAQYYLSFMYLEGQGTSQDPEKALRWMKKSAAGGFASAQVQMGLKHLAGSGVGRDPAIAHAFFTKAAASENPEAQYFLAVMAATGQGVPQNTDEALRWFRLSQSNGFPVPEDLLTQEGIAALGSPAPRPVSATPKPMVPSGKALIKGIQAGLTRLGYQPGPVDGLFGKKTASAIKLFQSRAGLAIDGKVSPTLLEQINANK